MRGIFWCLHMFAFSSILADDPNLPVYPNCGKPTQIESYRLKTNNIAEHGEHPWYAILKTKEHDETFCGGSLINSQFVLTAAHCFPKFNDEEVDYSEEYDDYNQQIRPNSMTQKKEDFSNYIIHLGRWKTDSRIDCPNEDDDDACLPFLKMPISTVIRHKDFKIQTRRTNYNIVTIIKNDIAIVKLDWSISYTNNVKPVCLPIMENLPSFTNVEVSGFGFTNSSHVTSTIMRKISMRVENCLDSENPQTQFCAMGNNETTCNGDSGGGAIVNDDFLVGVLSKIGSIKCRDDFLIQSTFTRVSFYIEWIKNSITLLSLRN